MQRILELGQSGERVEMQCSQWELEWRQTADTFSVKWGFVCKSCFNFVVCLITSDSHTWISISASCIELDSRSCLRGSDGIMSISTFTSLCLVVPRWISPPYFVYWSGVWVDIVTAALYCVDNWSWILYYLAETATVSNTVSLALHTRYLLPFYLDFSERVHTGVLVKGSGERKVLMYMSITYIQCSGICELLSIYDDITETQGWKKTF